MSLPAILITGGARRIGAAMARRFGESGWHVVVHYNASRDEAQTLAASLPSAQALHCDLTDPQAARAMVAALAKELPDWRALINNASVFERDDVTGLDMETNHRAMHINAAIPALLAQSFLECAKSEAGRRIIQLTDQKLANSNPDFFSYTMSKHAAASMVPMLAKAASATGNDRIYGLAPGAILASHGQSEAQAEGTHRLNLLQRRTSAAEVADAAHFLATGPLASGQTLFLDSGQHLLAQSRDVIYLGDKTDNGAPKNSGSKNRGPKNRGEAVT